jgi:hypothetical protein
LFLAFCLEAVKAEREQFERSLEAELTPQRAYEITKELTGDEILAEKHKAWQVLNNSR